MGNAAVGRGWRGGGMLGAGVGIGVGVGVGVVKRLVGPHNCCFCGLLLLPPLLVKLTTVAGRLALKPLVSNLNRGSAGIGKVRKGGLSPPGIRCVAF
ncbi:hypothetical protein F5X99DRAFT_364431 [Biscogniauxia marginata]|nr:hypothetical protein F5X99DRAFT_364431 [Biscogniauxia marginata]